MDLKSIARKRSPFFSVGPQDSGSDWETDGVADDVQIQQAITAASMERVGNVIVIPGNYNIATGFHIPAWVTLEGANMPFQSNYGQPPSLSRKEVARFNITNLVEPAVKLEGTGSCIEKVEFIYPSQNINSTPVVYPPTIQVGNTNTDYTTGAKNNVIRYINFGNSYIAVDARYHEKMTAEHCIGFPLYRGVITDTCYDIDLIQYNHWNPNVINCIGDFALIGSTLLAWVKANGMAFWVGRSDGTKLLHNFAYQYLLGAYVYGPYYRGTISDNYFDGCMMGMSCPGVISDSMITNNFILSMQHGLILAASGSERNVIEGNSINFNNNNEADMRGVWLENASKNSVMGNQLYGNSHAGSVGIRLVSANTTILVGNIVQWATGAGLQLISDDYNVITGNIFGNCGALSGTPGGNDIIQHNIGV